MAPKRKAGERHDDAKPVPPGLWPALKRAAVDWSAHKSAKAGAAIAYYSIFSMGPLHHAMTGTGAVAIAAAAAIPGTVVSRVARVGVDGRVRFGHPSGMLNVGAEAVEKGGEWVVKKVMMSRSARRLMEGFVRVPPE